MIITTKNGKYQVDTEDCWVRNHMSSGEVFESHIINGTLKDIIEKSKYIVDVGANIGCHTVSYALFNEEANIWSFEPQDQLFGFLCRNIKLNGLQGRVSLHHCGLGHTQLKTTLASCDSVYVPTSNEYNMAGLGIGSGGQELELHTLDSFNLPGLDFIKIDVEGAEGLVIEGAAETIKKYKPIVFFEHNYQTIDPKMVGLTHVPTPFEALVKLGYKNFTYVDWENYIAYP